MASGEPETLDFRGMRCPLPVIRLEARLRRAAPGDQFRVMADDPIAAVDIPHACAEGGHTVTGRTEDDGICVFMVTTGPKI